MNRLPNLQALARRTLTANADLIYRKTGVWSDGTSCRFSLQDPNKGEGGRGLVKVQTNPMTASLRLLRVHPADRRPVLGATLSTPDGLVVLGVWGDTADITLQGAGVCRLVSARTYPVQASVGVSPGISLRIEALDSLPTGTVSGNDLAATLNDSHRAYLPPGVHLQPGDVLVTTAGDEYQVVPPVQRDPLGDTLGLSWRGPEAGRTHTPETDPTPATPPLLVPAVPDWWKENT